MKCERNIRRVNFRHIGGRDSSVGIVTRYGLDGPGSNPRCVGGIFDTCADRPCGTPNLLYNWYRMSLAAVKWQGLTLSTHFIYCWSYSNSTAVPLLTLKVFMGYYRKTVLFFFTLPYTIKLFEQLNEQLFSPLTQFLSPWNLVAVTFVSTMFCFQDIFFSVVGCALFIAAGAFIIQYFDGFGKSEYRDIGLAKGAMAIINGVVFLADALLSFRGE